MRIVDGKRLSTCDGTQLAELAARYERVLVDVGTGDARTAYRIAKANPSWLVIGVDPAWQRMVDTSVRGKRKPAKGGLSNLLLVAAAIEDAPAELTGMADEVLALMPWGKLLRGIVLGEADVCAGLRAVAKPGARLQVTIGTSIWEPPIPKDIADLPRLDQTYARDLLRQRWADAGWRLAEVTAVTAADVGEIASSWARRLGSGQPEPLVLLTAEAMLDNR